MTVLMIVALTDKLLLVIFARSFTATIGHDPELVSPHS